MKQLSFLLALLLILSLCSCAAPIKTGGIAATTLPVYQFTEILCRGTDLSVTRLVTESVSCLHDYSLKVTQVQAAESADLIVISGAGLEGFMEDLLADKPTVDASAGIHLLEGCHEEGHEGHHHEEDPHIWLSPENAMQMAENICNGLIAQYPAHRDTFQHNLQTLKTDLQALLAYGKAELSGLSCRKLITFHDGFSYFAQAFGLEILSAVEEESGAEASAKELITLIKLVQAHQLPAVFIEENGSASAANVIAAETGTQVFTLSMVMSGDDYFADMYRNIDTIKEALA